jgi:hypothetical protein
MKREREREGKTWESNSPMGIHGIRPGQVIVYEGMSTPCET